MAMRRIGKSEDIIPVERDNLLLLPPNIKLKFDEKDTKHHGSWEYRWGYRERHLGFNGLDGFDLLPKRRPALVSSTER